MLLNDVSAFECIKQGETCHPCFSRRIALGNQYYRLPLAAALQTKLSERLIPKFDVKNSRASRHAVLFGEFFPIVAKYSLTQFFRVDGLSLVTFAEPENSVFDALCGKAKPVQDSAEETRLLLLGFLLLFIRQVLKFKLDVLHLALLLPDHALLLSGDSLLDKRFKGRWTD